MPNRVPKLMDAVPGEILAWRKRHLKAGSTTGHTCMIAGKPEKLDDGKVRVRLIDSTRAPHESDTRPDGKPEPIKWLIRDERLKFVIENGKVIRLLRG